MVTRLLPAGERIHTPKRQIYVAQNVDIDRKIIDVVPEPSLYTRPAQPNTTTSRSPMPQPPADQHPGPRPAGTWPAGTHSFATPAPFEPAAHVTSEPMPVFPDQLTRRQQQVRQDQPSRHFGVDVNPADPDNVIVTIYGRRWIVIALFLAIILIGFSLEKLPVIVPVLLDLFA